MGKNSYTDEFKKQIVLLYQNGKTILEIFKEYGVSKSAVYQWIEKFNNSGSFKASGTDNRQKIEIINNNKEKYSVRKMGQILKIAKSTYYYQINKYSTVAINNYEQEVIGAFNDNRKNLWSS